jgi:hypothetical protein
MKAPVKAGRESRMQEPHKKGRANHLDPESCADAGNRVGEALTGAHAGQPWSSEITSPGVPTSYGEREGHIRNDVTRQPPRNATESKTLGMRGNSLHGNRETPKASVTSDAPPANGGAERPEKAYGRTSGMHAFEERDGVRYFFRGSATAPRLSEGVAACPSDGGVRRLFFLEVLELVHDDSALGEG